MVKKRSFWISLCLINLCIVALLGFLLRSKILFSIPFINYRYILSAHSHFAFAGWAGLCLITLLIYDLLPESISGKKVYQWILGVIEVSSLGMALTFPVFGYNAVSTFFSSLYIFTSFFFAWVFIKDLLRVPVNKYVRLLSLCGIISLVLSAVGPLALSYILLSRSGNSILYRDSIYTFLHFQYNGFFTLSIFALFFQYMSKKQIGISLSARKFIIFLCLSVVPALFLSLLWHNLNAFYVLAIAGCILILISLFYFFKLAMHTETKKVFTSRSARNLLVLSALSFGLKMALNVGTIIPALGDAVYGARPIIIGFLHLVFLGFLSFFVLSLLIQDEYFTRKNKVITYPFIVFGFGIIANESLLMFQGLGILFKTNSYIYNWLLWAVSIILLIGAVMLLFTRLVIHKTSFINTKAVTNVTAFEKD